MFNAVMLVRNRFMLTKQALETFFANSVLDWNLTVVDDESDYQTDQLLSIKQVQRENFQIVRLQKQTCNTALNRNLGIYWSEHYFGRGEGLYLSDNDAYFTPEWDKKLITAFKFHEDRMKLVGPYRHPYHHTNPPILPVLNSNHALHPTDAVQGLGHFMRWYTWDQYGPLSEHPGQGSGPCQSEDFAFCRKIVEAGYLVGSIQPEVVYHCGLTNSQGQPTPGSAVTERVKGVYYE